MTSAIRYQGRKTRRAGSEQRRQAILDAALNIIVTDGIRAVRHRAVAREADVPLSATTYYFKDISDLIADAFTLFAERALENVVRPFRDQAFALIQEFQGDGASRETLIESLAQVTTAFMLDELNNRRDHLIAEQAFLQEAILDPRLRELADLYLEEMGTLLVGACEAIGSPTPELDAEVIHARIMALEVRLLTHPELASEASVKTRMRHLLEKLVPHD
ncbi:TetR/AcrR family transcriptional regulator [Alloalcanivorax profundimaris]|uniref:TetR family transcriptional regulator n=1 Tax=Alloalcanivorax profundimaris TaxID=2735259 RepID=A0ABS0ATG6_9GAMM|nr:TetR family transcriptional regulator [Alloalcanivorax profundimaris]MAO61187.1 TetR family transcriptional regulator [Alcanivorax sp.]MBM1143120.1 TetR family transcriptional regulator [Alcanivorax sp. ZXX171]MCQ6261359.1 TetR family transcriptional regulator [Alcanivorax sp. MM125-6]UWN51574.1 HTH-type transcriptional regulator RcdA [Alcanivorax sp. ALC70]MAY10550.1 TetR family transcriptional regulator [Alcanivorax sp.]|tara:strand:+ start:109690 stop:110346 length:657 start_codon:yes stop_codon:yes gene_type:complete